MRTAHMTAQNGKRHGQYIPKNPGFHYDIEYFNTLNVHMYNFERNFPIQQLCIDLLDDKNMHFYAQIMQGDRNPNRLESARLVRRLSLLQASQVQHTLLSDLDTYADVFAKTNGVLNPIPSSGILNWHPDESFHIESDEDEWQLYAISNRPRERHAAIAKLMQYASLASNSNSRRTFDVHKFYDDLETRLGVEFNRTNAPPIIKY